MATMRIDWDELFPPPPVRAPRGETVRIDLGNVGDVNQSRHVNRAAKSDMPADIRSEILAGQSDEEQALRELSPIDALARGLEIPPRMENYQRGQNSLRTAEDILSMIPGPGNVIAARDAFQGAEDAGKAFGAGDTRGGLLNAALAALSGAGAVVGLPTSRTARRVAEEAKDTANVFLPPMRGPAAEGNARAMLDEGATNKQVFDETGMFFGPDGRLRVEVPDRGMTWRGDKFGPGETVSVGEYVNHPELFERMPELRDVPIELTDKRLFSKERGDMSRPVAQTAQSGNFEMTAGVSNPDWTREQIAKLLQYEIADRSGYGGSVRHMLTDMEPMYRRGVEAARAIEASPRPGDDLEAAVSYLAKTGPRHEAMTEALNNQEFRNRIGKSAQEWTSGNADVRQVRSRAIMPARDYSSAGPFPYRSGMRSFDKFDVIPQPNMTQEDISSLIADWFNYGGGRIGQK